jgi:hypothetical protein
MKSIKAFAIVHILTILSSCNMGPKASGTVILMFKGSSNTFVCKKGMSLNPENGLYLYGEQSTSGKYFECNMPDIKTAGTYSLTELAAKNPENKISLAPMFHESNELSYTSYSMNDGTVTVELDGSNATVTVNCTLRDQAKDSLSITNGQYIGTYIK